MTASDDIASANNAPHTRLFVASPTTPTLQQSPRRCSASPSWCRLPLAAAVCSCSRRRAETLDPPTGSVSAGRCWGGAGGGFGGTLRQFELGRLSTSFNGAAHCRRLSADDVSELNGGVLVDTSTLSDAAVGRRRTVDEPVYLPLGQSHRSPPPSSVSYYDCSVTGADHVFISDGRLHDNPDLLFAS